MWNRMFLRRNQLDYQLECVFNELKHLENHNRTVIWKEAGDAHQLLEHDNGAMFLSDKAHPNATLPSIPVDGAKSA